MLRYGSPRKQIQFKLPLFCFFLFFKALCFFVVCKNSPPNPRLLRFSPIFPQKLYSYFTLISIIYFALIFTSSVKSVSWKSVLHVDIQLFQHHLLKWLSFLDWIAFVPLLKVSWLYLCGSEQHFLILGYFSIYNIIH